MRQVYAHRLLRHMADARYQPSNVRQLADALGVGHEDFDAFRQTVKHMLDDGQVLRTDADTVVLPPPGATVVGTLRLNPKGFGFIVPDSPMEHGDLFVPPGRNGEAMDGDRVRARVRKENRRGGGGGRSPYVANVIDIIQRADNRFVGNLTKRGGQWLVQVDGKHIRDPIVVRDPGAKNAKVGDKVVLELVHYPSDNELGEGVITEVLGEAGEPDVETQGVIQAYGLRDGFTREVMEEARVAARGFDDIDPFDAEQNGGREDLSDLFILTIDPPDARDFDDAISIRRLNEEEDGKDSAAAYELGVHIADVSTFVKAGGVLDNEAYERGNSTYLPRKVLPMLPELLSNGVCSLQEGVPRFCKSAFMTYDRDGKVLSSRFARTVIQSNKRLTYLEAQALIEDDIREAIKHAKTEPKYPKPIIEKLKLMDELAKIILARRRKAGMIELAMPDVDLVFDDSGRVVDAQPEDDAFTHRVIEMFMVEANEAAARLFDGLHVPMVRRIHPDPPSHDTNALRQFARVAGFNVPTNPNRHELQTLLNAVRGKPAQHAVHLAVLRTLSQAEYAPLLIGHFALASEHYTHFTSPIRRYPDLVVHRGIDAYLEALKEREQQREHEGASSKGHSKGQSRGRGKDRHKLGQRVAELVPSEEQLRELAGHCSSTERNSESAEKDLRNYLVLELLSTLLGEDFEGTVTGVTGSGVYVQLDRYLVDGFIRVADVAQALSPRGERWQLNRVTGALVAQRSGKAIAIGARFIVRVASVDPVRRVLDLAIIEPIGGKGKLREQHADQAGDGETSHRRQGKGARKAHGQTMRFKQQRNKGGQGGGPGKGGGKSGGRGKGGKRGRR